MPRYNDFCKLWRRRVLVSVPQSVAWIDRCWPCDAVVHVHDGCQVCYFSTIVVINLFKFYLFLKINGSSRVYKKRNVPDRGQRTTLFVVCLFVVLKKPVRCSSLKKCEQRLRTMRKNEHVRIFLFVALWPLIPEISNTFYKAFCTWTFCN